MTDLGVKWHTVVLDLFALGTVGMIMVLIEKTVIPFRRGFFCADESIRYPVVPNAKFSSKTLAATCLSISFITVMSYFILRCGIILLIFFLGVTPTRRGFYCEDESIRYPFEDSTVPNWALYIYCFTIPLLVITVTEFFSHRRNRASGTFLSRPVPIWFIYVYRSLVDFLFGCAASQLVTDIGKYTIGRLRPNFIAVCEPNVDFTNCSVYGHRYITNYVCKNENDAKESRVSFPSGHSSFSAYTMLYIAIYIQMKWHINKRSNVRLMKSGVQLSLMLLAYYTALSRVMDNKHHWSDVSAGGLIGAVAASLTAKYVSCIITGTSPADEKQAREFTLGPSGNNSQPPQSNYDVEAPKELSIAPRSAQTRDT